MEPIILDALLEEKESKKGTKYFCVTIQLTKTLSKTVFLDPAEVELMKLTYGTNK